MTSIDSTGLSANFGIERKLAEGYSNVALYGTDAMVGTGNLLVVTFDIAGPLSGSPFSVEAFANEGQIPLSWSPGLPRGTRMPDRAVDTE